MGDDKVLFEEKFDCPHCSKEILFKRVRKVLQEPVRGEYDDRSVVEKSEQTKLV